jgi:hypothetical protein
MYKVPVEAFLLLYLAESPSSAYTSAVCCCRVFRLAFTDSRTKSKNISIVPTYYSVKSIFSLPAKAPYVHVSVMMIRFPTFRPNPPCSKTAQESLTDILVKAQHQASLSALKASNLQPRRTSAPTTSKEYAKLEAESHAPGVEGGG